MFNLFANDDDGDNRHRCPADGHQADPGIHYKLSHGEYRPTKPTDRRERSYCKPNHKR